MGSKLDRLGGRYGGEPEKAIADPGNEDVDNPVIQSSTAGGSNKSIRRPKEESRVPTLKDMVESMINEKSVGQEPKWASGLRNGIEQNTARISQLARQADSASRQSKGLSRLDAGWDIDIDVIEKGLKEIDYYVKSALKFTKSYRRAQQGEGK